MKKLGPINPDIENWDLLLLACGKIDDLIDLVNSQQEAIKKLERVYGTQTIPDIVLPADDKPKDRYRLMLTTSYSGIVENRLFDTKEEAEAVIGLIHKAMRGDTHRTDKVSARDMASRNPSPEAKKALEAAVQQSQEDMNKMSTHRTVTLRIPKGMRVGKALFEAWDNDSDDIWSDLDEWLQDISDTDLQKALDEVEHE